MLEQGDIIKIDRGCPSLNKDEQAGPVCRKGNSSKLNVYDWLEGIRPAFNEDEYVEIRFKNTRKGFYLNVNQLELQKGDMVAVEASPGHDIGVVSLTGELVKLQMRNTRIRSNYEFPKIYRLAKTNDIERWEQAIEREHETMIKARKIAEDLKLDMKIGDVEYQGDGTKAIFYYIADGRVDFRELIKILADEFRIRIEMKQIGARQEAGRIGGIGSCGRELCCSTFVTNFVSVTTNSARYQELSLNPQKLAGQCGKLKCCLNYELDAYLDAQSLFPDKNIILQTKQGNAYHFKTDVFRGVVWYTFDRDSAINVTPVPVERVKEIIRLNKKNIIVDTLQDIGKNMEKALDYNNVVGEDDLTRFDKKKTKRKGSGNRKSFKKRTAKKNNPKNNR